MTIGIQCPRCGKSAKKWDGCQHLRWVPEMGGPIDFAKSVLEKSPCTQGAGFSAASIPNGWWENQHDWLLERIMSRLGVIDGYCFGEPVDLDRLCLDIWHRFAPQPERAELPRVPYRRVATPSPEDHVADLLN